jgi:hypothetical protein
MSDSNLTKQLALEAAIAYRLSKRGASVDVHEPRVLFEEKVKRSTWVVERATWIVKFYPDYSHLTMDVNPDYVEYFVDDLTGEVWDWYGTDRKPSPTTWNNPWLRKKAIKEMKRRESIEDRSL